MTAQYDKMYNIWIKNETMVPATYGNVSLYSQQNADINAITTTKLGIACDSSFSVHVLDVSGAARFRDNLDISGNINSTFLDASLNLRALDTVVVKTTGNQTIGGDKTLTGTLTSNQSMVITGATTKEMKVENTGGSLSSSMSSNGIRTTGYFWGQAQGGNSYRGTTTANTNFYITNDELSYLPGITSSVQTQLNSKIGTSGNNTFTGANTFTGDVSFNTGVVTFANGLTTNNSINMTAGTLVGPSAIRMANGSIQTSGGIYFPSSDLNRKIVLAPVASNEFQNYSIGTNVTSEIMQFMVPDLDGRFRFSAGTSTTTKADILDITPVGLNLAAQKTIVMNGATTSSTIVIEPDVGISLYGQALRLYNATNNLVMTVNGFNNILDFEGSTVRFRSCAIQMRNVANTVAYGGWDTTKLDLSGTYLQLESQIIHRSNTTVIGTTATISKPYNQFYPVEATGTAYTITLPTITAADLGKEIMFRKVRQTGTAVSISFIGNGSQRIYNTSLSGGSGSQSLMTSTTYIVRLLPLPDPAAGAGLFGWFST